MTPSPTLRWEETPELTFDRSADMPARLKARVIRGKPRGRIKDLANQRFGLLVAVRFYGMYHGRSYRAIAPC